MAAQYGKWPYKKQMSSIDIFSETNIDDKSNGTGFVIDV